MKKSFLVLGLALAAVGCKQEVPVDYAIVEGNITNFEGKELAINHLSGDFKNKINIGQDGSFVDTLKTKAGTFALTDGKNRVQFYLDKGDRIKVSYDAADASSSLNFEGSAAGTAKYYEAKIELSKELKVGTQNIYTLEEEAFLEHINKIKDAHLELLAGDATLSESFKALETSNIGYEYLNQVNNFELYHGYYTNNREFKASENISNQLKDVSLEDETAYNFSPAYKGLVVGTYNQQASELVKQDSIEQGVALLKAIATNGNQAIKDELLYNNAKVYLSYSEDPKSVFDLYMTHAKDEERRSEIQKDYEKILTLAEGNPSPQFTDYENIKGGTTSLEDLKGKYVYIDVWATWCGPCKREIPFLKELEADFHGKNIEFVSVSIDKEEDHDKWVAMVEEKELGGIQLFADNDWNSQFVQDYMIKGIPRFILVDPQGNIVNSNAARPSSEEIREVFNGLDI